MVCVINQSHAKAGEELALETMYKALLESENLARVEGFVAAYFLAPTKTGDTYQTVMVWQDEGVWKSFLRSEQARQSLGNLNRSLTSAPPQLGTFTVVGHWSVH